MFLGKTANELFVGKRNLAVVRLENGIFLYETGRIVGDNGKIDISKTEILMFDQFEWNYNVLGGTVGKAGRIGKELM